MLPLDTRDGTKAKSVRLRKELTLINNPANFTEESIIAINTLPEFHLKKRYRIIKK